MGLQHFWHILIEYPEMRLVAKQYSWWICASFSGKSCSSEYIYKGKIVLILPQTPKINLKNI